MTVPRLDFVFTVADAAGDRFEIVQSVVLPGNAATLRGLEIRAGGQPLVGLPFQLHEGGGYHTVCHLNDDELEVWYT